MQIKLTKRLSVEFYKGDARFRNNELSVKQYRSLKEPVSKNTAEWANCVLYNILLVWKQKLYLVTLTKLYK